MNQPPQVSSMSWPVVRTWLTIIAVVWFLGFIGLGWLVKSFLILIGLVVVTPIIAFIGLRWWLGRNLVQAPCPVCNFNVTGLNNSQTRCPNCGEALSIENQVIQRPSSPGTIDVQAVEVTAQVLDED